ncbi:MAG: hypothetical protein COA97_10800 [Flavobacteriales bacterium]|nr:MAG: hypothetical protein COA97_10800 [Flavobacteriales bacterium]
MEQDNNKRLDELFNQAKNEPSKVSFEETKEQFVNSIENISSSVSTGGNLAQFSNLKTLIMITTISAITVGAIMVLMNDAEPAKLNTTTEQVVAEFSYTEEESIEKEHKQVVKAHFEKVNQLPANLKEIYDVKVELALKIMEPVISIDSLKKYQLELNKSERKNEFMVDTAYRFPNLNYTEIQANNRQKVKMFGKVKKSRKGNGKFIGKKGREQWYQPDPKGFLFIPMGTMQYKEKNVSVQPFYMKQTEVTNLEYRTFLFDLLIQGRKDEFLIAKPDQTRWMKDYPYSYNKPMQTHYFSHAAYDHYPVVAMSRKGAEMYCKWFTTELNKVNNYDAVNDVRIPTDIEWVYAAQGGKEDFLYPWGGPNLINSNGYYMANFKPNRPESYRQEGEKFYEYCYICDGAFHTAKVESYNPNDFGLYCMSGNVAEMVYNKDENMTPGTKGGSWTSIGQELQIIQGKDRFKGLEKPSVDVGFRPVMTFLGSNNYTYIPDITVIPPGTAKISSNLYFDKTEVTNFNWKEYVTWNLRTHGKESKQHKEALLDTMVWKSKLAYNEPFVKHYYRHPAYNNYPVVGITYEQAVAFCKWRTDRVKELYKKQKIKNKKDIFPTNFKYRLPTKQEWERIANASYSEKILKKLEGKYAYSYRVNIKRNDKETIKESIAKNGADVTALVTSYWPNKYGIYNMIGNVAEMISEKGIAKGGAWNHQEKDATTEKDYKYTKANCWVGFRCVFEIID